MTLRPVAPQADPMITVTLEGGQVVLDTNDVEPAIALAMLAQAFVAYALPSSVELDES